MMGVFRNKDNLPANDTSHKVNSLGLPVSP